MGPLAAAVKLMEIWNNCKSVDGIYLEGGHGSRTKPF